MPSLSDKLKSLGVKIGARDLPASPPRRELYAIEQVLSGHFQATSQGEVFAVETLYALDHRHGRVELQATTLRQKSNPRNKFSSQS